MIAAIIFASAVISGSLVFSSLSLTGQLSSNVIGRAATTEVNQADIDQKVQAGIADYAKQKANEPGSVKAAPAVANTAAQNVRKIDTAKDYVRGDAKARITLVEYSDFECPYCRTFHTTAKQLTEEYKGKVNWTYRHYPLPSHDPAATLLAVAAECAGEIGGNDAFWKFSDELFAPSTARAGDDAAWAVSIGTKLGLNKAKMESCVKENKHLKKVQDSYAEGSSFGVNGTPGNFLIDNQTGKVQFIPGALPISRLKTLVDGMLAVQ